MRVSAVDLKEGDVLSKGGVVSFCIPVDMGMMKGFARMGNIERAAVIGFVGKPGAILVIDRISFDVQRATTE
jgi:hypothetical protein